MLKIMNFRSENEKKYKYFMRTSGGKEAKLGNKH
jgi:hypothetical protein